MVFIFYTNGNYILFSLILYPASYFIHISTWGSVSLILTSGRVGIPLRRCAVI